MNLQNYYIYNNVCNVLLKSEKSKFQFLLFQEVTCDPHAVSQEFSRLTYSIPSSKALMDLDVGIEREDLFPGRQKHPGMEVQYIARCSAG